MNTVCLCVFWNVHEDTPGEFDFTGNNDLRHFIELCGANGMNVILRPGPYVCAEWDMGGLPWWLLKDRDMRMREDDPAFMERVALFEGGGGTRGGRSDRRQRGPHHHGTGGE